MLAVLIHGPSGFGFPFDNAGPQVLGEGPCLVQALRSVACLMLYSQTKKINREFQSTLRLSCLYPMFALLQLNLSIVRPSELRRLLFSFVERLSSR